MTTLFRKLQVSTCLLLIFFAFPLLATPGKKELKYENKLQIINEEIDLGLYKEAITDARHLAKTIASDQQFNSVLSPLVLFAQARAEYLLFDLENAETSSRQALNKLTNLSSSDQIPAYDRARLSAVQYYHLTGNTLAAAQLLNKPFSSQYATAGTLANMKQLYEQGFLNEALNIAEKQEQSFQTEASSATKTNRLPKYNYVAFANLKAACLTKKGSYDEAGNALSAVLDWASKNNVDNSVSGRDSWIRLAENDLIRQDYASAVTHYQRAYTTGNFRDNEITKVYTLSCLISSAILAKQEIKAIDYLRRLEQQAASSLSKRDAFKIEYELNASLKLKETGYPDKASDRLKKLLVNLSWLPQSHLVNIRLKQLLIATQIQDSDIREALALLENQLAAIKTNQGETVPTYHALLAQKASLLIRYDNDLKSAAQIKQLSFDKIVRPQMANTHHLLAGYLQDFTTLYTLTDNLEQARAYAEEAQKITLLCNGSASEKYALATAKKAELLFLQGNYKEAKEQSEIAVKALVSVKNFTDPLTAAFAYEITSRLYDESGEYEKASETMLAAVKLTRQLKLNISLELSEIQDALALLYINSGNYRNAEQLLEKSYALKTQKLAPDNRLLLSTLHTFALLNISRGDFHLADHQLRQATLINNKVFDEKSLKHTETLLISANYYESISDYGKSEIALKSAQETIKNCLGKNHLRRAAVIDKLALIREKRGADAAELLSYFTESKDIIIAATGKESTLYFIHLQAEAIYYLSINKPEKAETLLLQADKFWTNRLGKNNFRTAEITYQLGNAAYQKQTYPTALEQFQKAQDMFEQLFNKNHPGYLKSTVQLAKLTYIQKNQARALSLCNEACEHYLDYTRVYFPSLSFREKTSFWNQIKDAFELYNSMVFSSNINNTNNIIQVFENTMATKGLLLSSSIKVKERIMNSNDSLLMADYNEWVDLKEYLVEIISLSKQQLAEQHIDVKVLEARVEALEKILSSKSEVFSQEKTQKNFRWKDVANVLNPNEYAIEMLRFRYFDTKFKDSVIYAALITGADNKSPETVLIPNGKRLEEKNLKYYRNCVQLLKTDDLSYKAFWEPIKAKIPDGAHIYISSEGVYNQINLEMLTLTSGEFVIDRNNINLVSNIHDVCQNNSKQNSKKKTVKSKDILLAGNPTFYQNRTPQATISDLPGTQIEISKLVKLADYNGYKIQLLTKDSLTEDNIKQVKSPRFFHIASHGYFSPDAPKNSYEFASNPLLNSGLLLKGAGDILDNKTNNYVNSQDGILTAYEAMNLNFDQTELAVLSACETGLGELEIGEGVYGLQRSFLIAGADRVVMSLFKVNDDITQKLMVLFYEKMFASNNPRQAFNEAKLEIKKQYKEPLYWGAFVMIGAK